MKYKGQRLSLRNIFHLFHERQYVNNRFLQNTVKIAKVRHFGEDLILGFNVFCLLNIWHYQFFARNSFSQIWPPLEIEI